MDVIAMKVGKTRLIENLSIGETLVINLSCNDICSLINPYSYYSWFNNDVKGVLSSVSHNDIIGFETIIIYSYYKYSDILDEVEKIKTMFKNKNVVLMVNEL